MKRYFASTLCSCFLLCSYINHAQVATATSTTTVNGKTTTTTSTSVGGHAYSSSTNNSGQPYGIAFGGSSIDDTTNWKWREVTKDFNINANAPIFIESAYRGIEIKTWDQPTVRIVAKARYKDDKDANASFDDIFEKAGVKVKSSDGAFEILGASNSQQYRLTYDFAYSGDNVSKGISEAGAFVSPATNTVVISSPKFNYTESGDSVIFNKDSSSTNLRILFRQKENGLKLLAEQEAKTEKAIALKKLTKSEKIKVEKITTLSKQLETLSKKLAALSIDNAEKNSAEITKLNKEIGKLSNQIAFTTLQKTDGTFNFTPLDSIRVRNVIVQPINRNIQLSDNSFYGISLNEKSSLQWTIYIPKNHKISIDSKYGNIVLDNDLDNVKIVSKYGNTETKNVQNLIIRNEYGNVYTGNVKDGDIEVRNGKLKMQNVDNLKINSKNTSVDLDEVGNIKVESSNDNYDVSSIQDLNANKNYGTFRLTTLNGKMGFNGVNADIKIRNISPKATNIEITNKFAKISLPFADIKNYNIAVNGNFNNSFDDFNKVSNNTKGFTATSGNGTDLTTNIKCDNCQLDFK